jgi:hypothetical protein
MNIDSPEDRPVDIARQALDDAQWHRATNEGWRHAPEPVAAPAAPPETLAPRMALNVPGRTVQRHARREPAAAKRAVGTARARTERH